MPTSRRRIQVQIACDDPAYRNAIAALLADDDAIEIASTSPEAEEGALTVERVHPDVVVLAVPPGEDVARHTELYKSAAAEKTAIVGFCTMASQAEAYRRAGVHTLVFPDDTAETLQEAIRAEHEAKGEASDT